MHTLPLKIKAVLIETVFYIYLVINIVKRAQLEGLDGHNFSFQNIIRV